MNNRISYVQQRMNLAPTSRLFAFWYHIWRQSLSSDAGSSMRGVTGAVARLFRLRFSDAGVVIVNVYLGSASAIRPLG